jgi:hypothetical protein
MRIDLSDSVGYWKYSWDISNIDEIVLDTHNVIKNVKSPQDGHGLWLNTKSKEWIISQDLGNMGDIILDGIAKCEELYVLPYNSVEIGSWVNVVNKSKTKQTIRNSKTNELIYHTHTEIEQRLGNPLPNYTFIFYIQMPDNLSNDDGKLFIKDKDGVEFGILPEVGDLIILEGDVPHAPVDAPNSTKDRIVIAGNVVFKNIKTTKTFI